MICMLSFAVYLCLAAQVLSQTTEPVSASNNDTLTVRSGFYFPLQENADSPALFPMPTCSGLVLEEATIDQLQDAMGQGKLTAVQLATCYLQRAYQVDKYIKSIP